MTAKDIEEIRARVAAATPGPWQVWDGPAYCGGGKDLCIGSGKEWLANMEHRWGDGYEERVAHDQSFGAEETRCTKYDCSICQMNEAITEEQRATAELIANAPTDLASLVAEVEALRAKTEPGIDTMEGMYASAWFAVFDAMYARNPRCWKDSPPEMTVIDAAIAEIHRLYDAQEQFAAEVKRLEEDRDSLEADRGEM